VINPTASPVTAHVKVVGTEYAAGTTVTRADPYTTFNGEISIPPGSALDTETQTCAVPAGAKFVSMTTHTNKRSLRTSVRDGGAPVFESTSVLDTPVLRFDVPPFHSFASGQLTSSCDYTNPGTNVIRTGDALATSETCIAHGFFFPSTKPIFCFNDFVVP
jgi:hypothetical protein